MQLKFIILILALLLASIVPVIAHAEPECRSVDWIASAYPAGDRFELLNPCITVSGPIEAVWQEAPDLGGEYHLDIWTDVGDGKGWVDTELPDATDYAALPAPGEWRSLTATVTGALVIDRKYGWRSLKPAWAVAGYPAIIRQYNERLADGSWRQVTQWRDGRYTADNIAPEQYRAAGIR